MNLVSIRRKRKKTVYASVEERLRRIITEETKERIPEEILKTFKEEESLLVHKITETKLSMRRYMEGIWTICEELEKLGMKADSVKNLYFTMKETYATISSVDLELEHYPEQISSELKELYKKRGKAK